MEAKSSETEDKGSWFKENQKPIIAVALIMLMAFIMRFVFAFGVSADSAFALSGGAVASEHLHTITEIMNGGSFFGEDGSLHYPFGSVNSNPVFIDMILAGIAMIGTSLGMATVKAASLTLATFSLVCGTAAIIPMFLLGKEVIGTKKAGYAAALFLAFCPVVITQTVFSNGTETGWILLLFLILSLLVFKGIKSVVVSTHTDDPFKEVLASNRSAIRMAAIAGLVLALIVLSTSDFRPIVLLLILSMIIMTVVGRFMYRETRMVALYFSIIIAIGMAVAAAYYLPAQLWDQVLSGILILSVASIVLCLTFAMLQRKPWVVTVPVYLIGVIVALVLLSTFVPELYTDIIKGNTEYAASVASLTGGTLSISHLSTDFGVVTLWFTIPIIGFLLWKLPKNISSFKYQFLLIFMIFSVCISTKSDEMATMFSPVYALGFAYIVMWIFDHVDFKTYFTMIKNAGFKTAWKKVLKPVPFLTIILVVLLLCVPIGMYSIDASISNNQSDDFDGMDLGAIGYYVKTDSDYTTGPVLSSYSNVDKSGALVTWMDYSADAATMGNFDVITDMQGNGAEAAANILLSNAVDGSSTGAMLIYLMTSTTIDDTIKGLLTKEGLMTVDQYNEFVNIINNPSDYKATVLSDIDKYGILRSDVSDTDVMYIYGTKYLTSNFDAYKISEMYSQIASKCGKISYFMVDGSMFPMYFGYSSVFTTMGYVNGYATTDDYGTIGQFLTADYYTYYYTGIYGYTDAMYDTLMWRTYIGMSPAEAGFTSGSLDAYQYFLKLMLSDGEYKAQPGYGLSNYTVDYDHWYVMYNADSHATADSDGWTKMLYAEAVAKQDSDGGLINYLSGLPVFLRYVSNDSGETLSGTITSAGAPLAGVRVSVVDSAGTVRSTAYTDKDGKYNILVAEKDSKIKYYSGSQNLVDGTLIKTVDYTSGMSGDVPDVATTTGNITFVNSDGDNRTKMIHDLGANISLKGKTSGRTYDLTTGITYDDSTPDKERYNWTGLVPDVYEVTVKSADGKTSYVTDATATANVGSNDGIEVTLDIRDVKLSIVDDAGAARLSLNITVKELTSGTEFHESDFNDDGIIEMNLVDGTYVCYFDDADVVGSDSATFTVTSSATEFTVVGHNAVQKSFSAFPENKVVTIYSYGYQSTVVSNGSGVISDVKLPKGAEYTTTNSLSPYTLFTYKDNTIYMANNASDAELAAVTGTTKVSGTMTSSSDEKVAGTILFVSGNYQIPVSVSSEGTYETYLKSGWTYTVYAVSGSDVSISTLTLDADTTLDIQLKEGAQISGKTYWGSESNAKPFVPITVSAIEGCDGCSFTIISSSKGEYSFYIPKDSSCTLTAVCEDPFYYDEEDNHSKTVGGVKSTTDFTAKVKQVLAHNTLTVDVICGGTSIPAGQEKKVTISSPSMTVTVDNDDYYSKATILTTPTMGSILIDTDTFADSKNYYAYTITGLEDSDKVTVKALDDGDYIGKKTYGDTRKYFLEYNAGDNKSFLFTITNNDSTKVMYKNVTVSAAEAKSILVVWSGAATVTGYVGVSGTGSITVVYTATPAEDTYEFEISSGRYSILVPVDKALTLKPTVTDTSDTDYTYTYTADEIGIAASTFEAGTTNTYNFAVTGGAPVSTYDMTATMTVDSMTDSGLAEVDFTIVFSNGPADSMTYVLSGGSAWSHVTFYSDSARTNEISTKTFTDTATVYGRGTINRSSVAYAADDLSVILKDINGNTACIAKVTGGDTNWSKTTPTTETTKVSVETNTLGDSEYKYALTLVNDDNYTKTFTLTPSGINTDDWFVTYVYDKAITSGASGAIEVKGYTTATVYVKITYKTHTADAPTLPESISVKVEVAGADGITTETSDSVTIEGNIANAVSETNNTTISIDDNGATGRDVLDSKSDMPLYLWVLIALSIAAVFLIIWMASKRGVFTRKK